MTTRLLWPPRRAFSLDSGTRKLRACGFQFDSQAAGSHEIWYSPKTNRYTRVPNHPGDIPEGTLRAILKQAGAERDDLLNT